MKLEKFKLKEIKIPLTTIKCLLMGFAIMILGFSANFIVIQTNNGMMPVWSNHMYNSTTHFTITNISKINNLQFADMWHAYNCIWSIGDILMILGCALSLYAYLMFMYNLILDTAIKIKKIKKKKKKRK